MFKIFETEQFQENLQDSFKGQKEKIIKKLNNYVYPQLRTNPFFGQNIKKLKNYNPETWRYRIGDFRFFYEIDDIDKLVIMITATTRQGAY